MIELGMGWTGLDWIGVRVEIGQRRQIVTHTGFYQPVCSGRLHEESTAGKPVQF
jgi:hypothetical protein